MKFGKFLLSLFLVFGIFSLVTLPTEVRAQSKRGTSKTPVVTPSPSPSPSPDPVDSYDLFWPISAGRVMGDPLYFLKSLKESLRELLVFGDYKKAEYNITLAEKRLLESEYLFKVKKDFENTGVSVIQAKSKMEKAVLYVGKSKDSSDISALQRKLSLSADKQRRLLNYLITLGDKEQTKEMSDYEDYLSSLLSNPQ